MGDSGMPAKPPEAPTYPRGRVRDGLADRPSVQAEFDGIVAWEDDMLAFCNEVAAKADRLTEALREIKALPARHVSPHAFRIVSKALNTPEADRG